MNAEELNRAVSFPQWAEALAADPAVGAERQAAYLRAIVSDLKHRPFF